MNVTERDLAAIRSRPGEMRAAIVTGAGRCSIVRTTIPTPGPRDVLFQVEGCGVCASNLGPWSGPDWMNFPTEPGALGHEAWGRVVDAGKDVTGLAHGDRIAALSYNGYAEFDVAPVDRIAKLPPALDGAPFPGEPLACAVNVLRRSRVSSGHRVAIVGVGFLGALLTRLARNAGAHVVAISRRPTALRAASQAGAAQIVPFDDVDGALAQACGGAKEAPFDCVIEATGHQLGLDLASKLVRERGRLVIAGYHQDGPRMVDMQMWNWRGLDVVNAHEREPAVYMRGMREAIDLVAGGRLDPGSLLTHPYPLERLDDALNATRDRPDGFMKGFIDFS